MNWADIIGSFDSLDCLRRCMCCIQRRGQRARHGLLLVAPTVENDDGRGLYELRKAGGFDLLI